MQSPISTSLTTGSRRFARSGLALLGALGILALAACGGAGDAEGGDAVAASGVVRNVPEDYPTIQAAVDAAEEGDLVLIAPGVYYEEVEVTTDNIVIRGLERNEVILDGEFDRQNGIQVVGADGVSIENMTAMNYERNGFLWTGVTGYRGSYLSAVRNGDYGIYAFDAVGGLFEHSYAAGSTSSGFYIGQCYPCDAVITDVVSEHNALGYSGTNAGGNLFVVNSTFRFNRMGIVPNSGTYELCYPQRETVIAGNRVYSNNQPDTAAFRWAVLFMGSGIFVSGGIQDTVRNNRVWDHDQFGIALAPYLEWNPSDDLTPRENWSLSCAESRKLETKAPEGSITWEPLESRVFDNVVEDSRISDLVLASTGVDLSTLGNCFSGNTFATSSPNDIETLAPCTSDGVGDGSGDWFANALDMNDWFNRESDTSRGVRYDKAPLPGLPILENMPDAATAPARPASSKPPKIDLDSIEVPDRIS